MKLEITREVKQKETVEIDLPYYYKHDIMPDDASCVIYGKIEEKRHTAIKISRSYISQISEFEISIEERRASSLGCYMTYKYKSSEEEYLSARDQLLAAVKDA